MPGALLCTFRSRTLLLLRARWGRITVATLISHLSLFLVLLLSLRFVGVTDSQVSWAETLAIFAFARLLTAIPLTPGGLGVVELALITGLAAVIAVPLGVLAGRWSWDLFAASAGVARQAEVPVPLVLLTCRRDVMGAQVNRRVATIFAWSCAVMIIGMNIFLICQQPFLS